jgi:hypothetical protein
MRDMNDEYLRKIKNTLLVILKARNHPDEVGLLGLGIRWEPESVENSNYYEDDSLWRMRVFLPAEAYAIIDRESFSKAEDTILSTLNEISAAQGDRFTSLNFCPELVDKLSFDQQQLMEWIDESLNNKSVADVIC